MAKNGSIGGITGSDGPYLAQLLYRKVFERQGIIRTRKVRS